MGDSDTGPLRGAWLRLLIAPARFAWRGARRMMHLMLHPARNRIARRRVRKTGTPHSIVFVCVGNICRSPYAAGAILRDLPRGWNELIRIDSAGFVGPDRPSPGHAIAVAAERGVDLSDHRSKLLTRQMVQSAGLVVVMEPRQRKLVLRMAGHNDVPVILLGDLRQRAGKHRWIVDPFDGERDRFAQSYDEVDDGIGQLAEVIARS